MSDSKLSGVFRFAVGAMPSFALALMLGGCAAQNGAASSGDHRLAVMAPSGGGPVDNVAAYAQKPMTRDELKFCLTEDHALDGDRSSITARQASLKTRRDTMSAEQADIETKRSAIDAHSPKSVAAFNDEIVKFQTAVNQYNTQSAELNGEAKADNARVVQRNKACAGRPFYIDEMQLAAMELGLPPEGGAKAADVLNLDN